jgi:hypothetical protein
MQQWNVTVADMPPCTKPPWPQTSGPSATSVCSVRCCGSYRHVRSPTRPWRSSAVNCTQGSALFHRCR